MPIVLYTRGQRLRAARAKRFRSARAAAIALAIPVSTYGAHERAEAPGGRDYGPEEAQRYAERFDVTAEWLLTGHRAEADGAADVPVQNPPLELTELGILGYVGTARQSHYYAVAPEDVFESGVPVTQALAALEIRGESLGSELNHWFVVYDDMRRLPPADLVGRLCVVALEDERILVKRLARGTAKGAFDLISPNAPPIRNVRIQWASKVKAIVRP